MLRNSFLRRRSTAIKVGKDLGRKAPRALWPAIKLTEHGRYIGGIVRGMSGEESY
jgi:hypothetical protein